jgi:signal transduction histidine kinase
MVTHESSDQEKPFGLLAESSVNPVQRVWGLRHAAHLQSMQHKAWTTRAPQASDVLACPSGLDRAEAIEWLHGLNRCFPDVPVWLSEASVSLGVVTAEGEHLLWPNTLRDGPDGSVELLQPLVHWQQDAQSRWWLADSMPVGDSQGPVLQLIRWLQIDVRSLMQDHQDALALLEMNKMAMWRVGHDLRTPLNTVFGVAELITMDMAPDPSTLRDWHDSLQLCRSHFEDTLQDALCMPSMAVDKETDQAASVDLAWNVVDRMLRESRLKKEIVWDAHDLSCVIKMPMHVAVEILLNLANNALKNSPAGRVVKISATRGPEQVQLEIVNDLQPGRRFSAPDLSRSARDIDWRESAGAGLGLATSAFLARRHQGDLQLEFMPPCHCKATLRVPAA